MIRVALIALLLASPAHARWDYCYFGAAPDGVSPYPDMPPRSFGFEIVLLPHAFKVMCGLPAEDEAAHLLQTLADDLECSADSSLGGIVGEAVQASPSKLLDVYLDLGTAPDLPAWAAVCTAAEVASIANLSFADRWYFDSPTAQDEDQRLRDLLAALQDLSAVLAEGQP